MATLEQKTRRPACGPDCGGRLALSVQAAVVAVGHETIPFGESEGAPANRPKAEQMVAVRVRSYVRSPRSLSSGIGTPGSDFDARIDSADLTWVTLGAAVSWLVRNRS